MSKPRHIPSPFFDNCIAVTMVIIAKLTLLALMAHTVVTQGLMS
jgi:hypothetical protein